MEDIEEKLKNAKSVEEYHRICVAHYGPAPVIEAVTPAFIEMAEALLGGSENFWREVKLSLSRSRFIQVEVDGYSWVEEDPTGTSYTPEEFDRFVVAVREISESWRLVRIGSDIRLIGLPTPTPYPEDVQRTLDALKKKKRHADWSRDGF